MEEIRLMKRFEFSDIKTMKLLNMKYALLPYSKFYVYLYAFVVKSCLVEDGDFLFTWVKPMCLHKDS